MKIEAKKKKKKSKKKLKDNEKIIENQAEKFLEDIN